MNAISDGASEARASEHAGVAEIGTGTLPRESVRDASG